MLKIELIPQLFKIISKLDMKPIIEHLKNVDIYDENEGEKTLSKEKVGLLTFEIFSELMPQLGKIGADIPEFVSIYKGVSLEEAKKLDLAEIINDIVNDEGILFFFKRAFKKRAEQE